MTNATKHMSPILRLTYSAICIAMCLVLPFLTGQIPQIGSALCPMHLPVLLAGYLCGPWWGVAVGACAPLLRHLWLGMPPLVTALGMTFELGTYGLVVGMLYRLLPKKLSGIYISLLCAMVAGRAVWGCAMMVIMGISGSPFTWSAFLAGALLNAIPGIVVQLVLIPLLVRALHKAQII
jgi:predicted membrane protein